MKVLKVIKELEQNYESLKKENDGLKQDLEELVKSKGPTQVGSSKNKKK